MSTELDPVVGNWYRHLDKGQQFCIVALDEEAGLVEVQHFDGDIEEIGLAAWYEMTLEVSEAPEDWTGPVDDVETDDLPYSETGMDASNWRTPLEELPRPSEEAWEDKDAPNERDEWAEGTTAEEMETQQEIEESVAQSAWTEKGDTDQEVSVEEEEAEPRE